MLLIPNRLYKITDITRESGYSSYRSRLIGMRCKLIPKGRQFKIHPNNARYPQTLRHAEIQILSGECYAQFMTLTFFRARLIPHQQDEVCECSAYSFPHRGGGGKCKPSPYRAWCGDCGLACRPLSVDRGIGWTDFWGKKSFHEDWQCVSECCESSVYGDSACTLNYTPEELEHA